jgi:hypothetical protein
VSGDTACYHYNLVDDLELKKIHKRSTEIMKMINTDMDERLKSSTINLPDVADFDQGGTNIQSINFPPLNQSLERKRKKLRECLEQEIELKRLLRSIDVCIPDPKDIVQINKMIPCILHLEIRVGIKMFSMIVSQGLSAQADGNN